jgi:NADH-quinone oxidoreductase subunit N
MTTSVAQNLHLILPETFLAFAAMGLALFAAFSKPAENGADMRGVGIAAASLLFALLLHMFLPAGDATAFSGMIAMDRAGYYMKALVLGASAVACALAAGYYRRFPESYAPEFACLLLLAAIGMSVMAMARHFLALYVSLELQSLALYVLAALHRRDALSSEAGMKYFVLGALSSCLLLFGVSLVYGATGSLYYAEIAAADSSGASVSGLFGVGILTAMTALLFKVSAAPFHSWTPDVYQGAPKPAAAFFATAAKAAAAAALLNFCVHVLYHYDGAWRQALLFVALASTFVGAFAGIAQSDLRRLAAFSSVGHMGYALLGFVPGNAEGTEAVMVYIAVYVTLAAGFFACLMLLHGSGRGSDSTDMLKGLAKRRPRTALALAVVALSMAGVPPFAGFFAKLLVFKALVAAGYVVPAVLGISASVIACFYYLRLVKCMYFDEAEEDKRERATCYASASVLAGAAAINLFFVFGMDFVMIAVHEAAIALF